MQRTPVAFTTKKTRASSASTDPLQISPVLSHRYSCSQTHLLSPSQLPLPIFDPAKDQHRQAANTSLDPHSCLPTMCAHMGLTPLAVYLNTTALTPKAAQLLVGPDLTLATVSDLSPRTQLHLTSPAEYLAVPSPNFNTSLHCWAPMLKFSNACQQPGLPQLPVHIQLAPALATVPGPYHHMCVCSWPLPLHRDLQMFPETKCVYSISYSHHYCLPWFLAVGPGDAIEDPNRSCRLCGHPQHSPRTMQ